MSELREPRPAKLFFSFIHSPDAPYEECIDKLRDKLGEIDFMSESLPFERTSYYEEEMGSALSRKIFTFKNLIKRDELPDIKVYAVELEKLYSTDGKRKINIDPGYIAPEHLILSTGKGYYHRSYIGKGVYADLTLVYQGKDFRTVEWTYPDYGSDSMRKLFKELREKYMHQLSKETNA